MESTFVFYEVKIAEVETKDVYYNYTVADIVWF